MARIVRLRVERTQFAEFQIIAEDGEDDRVAEEKAIKAFNTMPTDQRRVTQPTVKVLPAAVPRDG